MKKAILLLAVLGIGLTSYAQRVKEKDVLGTWKLIINIEEEMEREAEEADTMLEEVIINAVSGFVDGILDDIDIYFDFREDNEVKITVYAYDEKETEYGKWYINKRGYLEIEDVDDNGHISFDNDDDEWKLIDGILVSDDHEDDRTVYMTRVD